MPKAKLMSDDVGNGKAALAYKYSSAIEAIHFPSIRIEVDEHGFGDDHGVDRWHWVVEENGQSDEREKATTFVVGDDALGKDGIIEHDRSLDRLGGEFELFLFNVLLAKVNDVNQRIIKKKDIVNRIACVPPKFLDDAMRERYANLCGTYYLWKNDETAPYTYTIAQCDVIEEGRGAMTAFTFDNDGRPTSWFKDIVQGRTKLVDLGYKTMDLYDYENGFIRNRSRYEMTDNAGILPGIVLPLLRMFNGRAGKKHSNGTYSMDWLHVNQYDIERAVREFGRGNYEHACIWVGDHYVPISKEIGDQCAKHAKVIRQMIESDVNTEGLGRAKALMMVGGGEILMQPSFQAWYPNKFININDHPATCGITDASIVLNAIGDLIFKIAEGNRVVN